MGARFYRLIASTSVFVAVWSICCYIAASAVAIPEGRVYELVSPVYKGGYAVVALEAADLENGEQVAFTARGVIGAALSSKVAYWYVANRGGSGWLTAPMEPPSVLAPVTLLEDVSMNFQSSFAFGVLGSSTGNAQLLNSGVAFWQRQLDKQDNTASWETAGVLKRVNGGEVNIQQEGTSGDLCHIVVESLGAGVDAALLPEASKTGEALYDLHSGSAVCGGKSSLQLVGLNNKDHIINRVCGAQIGGFAVTRRGDVFNAISRDGRDIFFSTDRPTETTCLDPTLPEQVFVRLDGLRTIEISKPLKELCVEVPCEPGFASRAAAAFMGASEDGSRVFFTAPLAAGQPPLVPGDTDASNNLYMAQIGCPEGAPECEVSERTVVSLVDVSSGANSNEPADVLSVVRVAPDGSRVYFVAHGALGKGANAEGHVPLKGADNLYVYDSETGEDTFIVDLCSGPDHSGEVEDVRCPTSLSSGQEGNGQRNDTNLWSGSVNNEAQSTADGGFLVFSSFGQLVKDDTDSVQDVYRYDAANGVLARVSLGEDGHHQNGNGDEFPVDDARINAGFIGGMNRAYKQREMGERVISGDGSRIVFKTAEPLSAAATNGLVNIYEWHETADHVGGSVLLLSGGSALADDCCMAISQSGRDVFFGTSQGLVSQDADGLRDIYDARLEGGFPEASAPAQECSADSCQGPLTNPLPLLVPGSVTQAPGENLPPPKSTVKPKKRKSKKTRKRAKTHKKAGTHR